VFVSPGDVLVYNSSAVSNAWCYNINTSTSCSNAEGFPYLPPAFGHQTLALVFRYGNATNDAMDADWFSVFPLSLGSQQVSTWVVPLFVPPVSQLWLAAWDTYQYDNTGSVTVSLSRTPAVCPSTRPSSSTGTIAAPISSSTAGKAFSDPRIVGFWGQDLYVAGQAGNVYSLLSDGEVQLNARFVQLQAEDIQCPTNSATFCVNHTGTYFGSLSLALKTGERVVIDAGSVSDGFNDVSVNGHSLSTGQQLPSAPSNSLARMQTRLKGLSAPTSAFSVLRLSHREIRVTAGLYLLDIANMDGYMDLVAVQVSCWHCMEKAQPEGLLGRTWDRDARLRVDDEEVDAYRVQSKGLFGCSIKDRKCVV
jgi:hypothetical protein